MSFIPGLERDFGYGMIGRFEALRGAFETKPPNMVHERFTGDASKNAMEVIRRKTRDGSKLIEINPLIQAGLKIDLRAQHPLAVRFDGLFAHLVCS